GSQKTCPLSVSRRVLPGRGVDAMMKPRQVEYGRLDCTSLFAFRASRLIDRQLTRKLRAADSSLSRCASHRLRTTRRLSWSLPASSVVSVRDSRSDAASH